MIINHSISIIQPENCQKDFQNSHKLLIDEKVIDINLHNHEDGQDNNSFVRDQIDLDLDLRYFKEFIQKDSQSIKNQSFCLDINNQKVQFKIPKYLNIHFSKLFAIEQYQNQFREYLQISSDSINETISQLLQKQKQKREEYISDSVERNFDEYIKNCMKIYGIKIDNLINQSQTNDQEILINNTNNQIINSSDPKNNYNSYESIEKVNDNNDNSSNSDNKTDIIKLLNKNENQMRNNKSSSKFYSIKSTKKVQIHIDETATCYYRKLINTHLLSKRGYKNMKDQLNSIKDLNNPIVQVQFNKLKNFYQFMINCLKQHVVLPKFKNMQSQNFQVLKFYYIKFLNFFDVDMKLINQTIDRLNIENVDKNIIKAKDLLEFHNVFDTHQYSFKSYKTIQNRFKETSNDIIDTKMDYSEISTKENVKINLNDQILNINDLSIGLYSVKYVSGIKLPFDHINKEQIQLITIFQKYGLRTDSQYSQTKHENNSGNLVQIKCDHLVKLQTIEYLYITYDNKLNLDNHKKIVNNLYRKYKLIKNFNNELETIIDTSQSNKKTIQQNCKNKSNSTAYYPKFNEQIDISDED